MLKTILSTVLTFNENSFDALRSLLWYMLQELFGKVIDVMNPIQEPVQRMFQTGFFYWRALDSRAKISSGSLLITFRSAEAVRRGSGRCIGSVNLHELHPEPRA